MKNWEQRVPITAIHADPHYRGRAVYEGEFDDVKTDAGEREVPFDKREERPHWKMEDEQALGTR